MANEVAWHALSVDEVAKRLTTDTGKGPEAVEAAKRLQEYGPNRLPEGKKRGPLMRFLSQFNNILVYVLLGAGFTKLMLNLWVDAAIIFGVVILNALLGFIQEGKAEKALESIRNMLSAEARTLRGGETRIIAAETNRQPTGRAAPARNGDILPANNRLKHASPTDFILASARAYASGGGSSEAAPRLLSCTNLTAPLRAFQCG